MWHSHGEGDEADRGAQGAEKFETPSELGNARAILTAFRPLYVFSLASLFGSRFAG